MVKVIYSLILLLFSSSVFADFVEIKRISISDLLDEGFSIKQIDYIKNEKYDYVGYTYHLHKIGLYGDAIAICNILQFFDTICKIDTNNKELLSKLREDHKTKPSQTFSGSLNELLGAD